MKLFKHPSAIKRFGNYWDKNIDSTSDPFKGSAYYLLPISAILMKLQAMHKWFTYVFNLATKCSTHWLEIKWLLEILHAR